MTRLPEPAWLPGYRRAWIVPDVIAGLVIWSVVVPQAVAYAQIAGLPPEAGLMAAPGAMLAYAILGTSRVLVVSATTATSALSAATVGPMAGGDMVRFAALSAALALVTGVVLVLAGFLRLGAISDFVSRPVMTGFLFGLGLTIMIGQLPAMLGVPAGEGAFFGRLGDLLGDLGDIDGPTLAVGAGSVAALVLLQRLAPALPSTLIVLAGAIAVSAAAGLSGHGVDVVGDIPDALPDPALPDVGWGDLVDLIAPAFGVLVVSAEAIGVARTFALRDGYPFSPNRDLVAMGGSNLLAGFSSGFVQSGGASQTSAADRAGGRTQLASIVAACLVLLTGAFLAPLFQDLPQATLAAIVVVAITGFLDLSALRRLAGLRRSAIVFALIALAGVLVLGVLQGLVVTAVASLVYLVQRISRPRVGTMARDPESGAWGMAANHPGWERPAGALVVRPEGLLVYPNVTYVRGRVQDEVARADPRPAVVVLELSANPELDVEGVEGLRDLATVLDREGVELRLAVVRAESLAMLRRDGIDRRIAVHPTVDEALAAPPLTPPRASPGPGA